MALVEAGGEVGGLCRTIRRGGLAYDLGGHILFVPDMARREWLGGLLGDDAIWVDRPVVCLRDGALSRGRYLDQRPDDPTGNGDGPSAHEFLAGRFGADFVDRVMRRYLEKVDGMPLERILATRARKLMIEQSAPQGFWYAAGGIGQLMDAMAAEVRRHGGDVLLGARVERIERRLAGPQASTPRPRTARSPSMPPALSRDCRQALWPDSSIKVLPGRSSQTWRHAPPRWCTC